MTAEEFTQFKPVDLWLTELAHEKTGSERTRELYLYALAQFCESVKLNPDQLIEKARANLSEVEMMVAKHFIALEKSGISRNSCVTYYASVRSFFRHNGVIFIKNTPQRWALRRARPLPKEELAEILGEASPRLKAFIAVMKDSGLAPVDIISLKVGDIDLNKEPPIPLNLVRMKTRIDFTTFLGPDAIKYLKRYLAVREKGTRRIPSETITLESPLFRKLKKEVEPATGSSIVHEWEIARAHASVPARLYDIRKFFNTQLRLAHVSDDIIEYWMGHKLYGPRGAYLVPTLQEQAAEYTRAYPRLSLSSDESVDTIKHGWKEQILISARLNPAFKVEQVEALSKLLDRFSSLDDVDWNEVHAAMSEVKVV